MQNHLNAPEDLPSNVTGDLRFPAAWTVFGPVDRKAPIPRMADIERIPKSLRIGGKTLRGRRLKPTRNQLDLDTLLDTPAHRFGTAFLVFLPIHAPEAGPASIGLDADYRFRAWFNGAPLFQGHELEHTIYPPAIKNRITTVSAHAGTNLLAVRFVPGRGSAVLAIGGPRELRYGDFRSILSDLYINEPAWRTPRMPPKGGQPCVDIASRRELFVDDFLIDRLTGGAERRLHHPVHRNIVLTLDHPWEGNVEANYLPMSIIEVDGCIRLYYKGVEMKTNEPPHRVRLGSDRIKCEHVCVAESRDGISFTRPDVKQVAFRGSRRNNIVLRRGRSTHNFAPNLDQNPDVPAGQRFKALAYVPERSGTGLAAYTSADGLRWKLLSKEPVVTRGAFDSQNTSFWDSVHGCYREYHRGQQPHEPRGIMTSVSDDFIHWSDPQPIAYDDDRREQMYTNCIRPYPRAPHILLGTPARLVPARLRIPEHSDAGVSDAVLMSSRDGTMFHRWAEGFIRPNSEPENWTDRNNYPAWGMVQTSPTELSLYWCEHNGHATPRIRRGTLRPDGFVSIHADAARVGELLTRPFRFSGSRLEVNYATSANGALLFELCTVDGKPIEGFTFSVSETLFGNDVARTVVWGGRSPHCGALAGRPVRLRVRLRDADLYAVRFA